jgi:hypothetical protein
MPSTARAAKTIASDRVQTTSFTRIHVRPSRSDYKILKQEAATIASKVEDITYDRSRNTVTDNEYRVLAKILGISEYKHQTGISTYFEENELDSYNPTIDDTTPNRLYRIPLVPVVHNNNTRTVLVKQPRSKFLPARSPPEEAVFNVYKLKTQPELVQYFHATAGFLTKLAWSNAVKNKHQFASWPGLTPKAVPKHFPESEETIKSHAQKAKSGQ